MAIATLVLVQPTPTCAVTNVFFSINQTTNLVATNINSNTIETESYLFTLSRGKLFTGGVGLTNPIGRSLRIHWPNGLEAQAITTGPNPGGARIMLTRHDGQPFDIPTFTFRLLANTAGAGAMLEIMPLLNGEPDLWRGLTVSVRCLGQLWKPATKRSQRMMRFEQVPGGQPGKCFFYSGGKLDNVGHRAGGARLPMRTRLATSMAGLCSSLAVEKTDKSTTQDVMKRCCKTLLTLALVLSLFPLTSLAQTTGSARLEATLLDYSGTTSPNHYTVVWVTTQADAFIKSLRKQGPSSWTSSEWGNHCGTWNTARAGSTALDGYTTATAHNYTSETFAGAGVVTNSPIVLTWNGRDASNNLMPDGNYKFWIQYAENSGQGPVTTSGLLWTKGTAVATNTYPNQGANFSNMKVIWSPAATPPTITSVTPPAAGIVGVPYNFTCTASGTAPITFTAQGLPAGLTISSAGTIAGNPATAGTFAGTITAANGTLPNATQPFSIVVSVVPANIAAVQLNADNLVLSGSGPANGIYTVLTAPSTDTLPAQWTAIATNSFDGAGNFSFTNAIDAGVSQKLYRLRVP